MFLCSSCLALLGMIKGFFHSQRTQRSTEGFFNELKNPKRYLKEFLIFMEKETVNNDIVNGNCWVAYFDILGFKNRLNDFCSQAGNGNLDIFVKINYDSILNRAKKKVKGYKEHLDSLEHAWFSDSFLFYVPVDKNGYSFDVMTTLARFFIVGGIKEKVPLVGAISVGEFYADKNNNVYIGPALVDAVEYTENQNWLGLVVSQKAIREIQEIDRFPSKDKYGEYDVPVKIKGPTKRLVVCKIHKHYPVEKKIREMRQKAINEDAEEKVIKKYDNTLCFIENN